jgi:hypothetical protein
VRNRVLSVLLCTVAFAGCAGTVGATPTQFFAEMRNQAIGLGGNVVLDTTVAGTGLSGVVYRCP